MKDSRCQNSPPPSSSHFYPFFLYIQHHKLPSKQANGDGSQVSKQPASTSFRWQPGDAFIHCWHRKLSDTWPPLSTVVVGVDAWKTGVEKHNWISLHQNVVDFLWGGLDGEEGIWNWVLAHVSCQDACHVFLWFYRHIHCISETLVRVWHLLLAEIRSPTDSDRFWLAIWQICQPVWESLLDCFVYCLLKYPYIWIVVM